MDTKWFIVDSHNQYIPPEAVSASKSTMVDLTDLNAPWAARLKNSKDIEAKLRVMDEAGVSMAVLHMAPLSLLGLNFCRAMNDGNARIARKYPGRFIPLAHLPLDGGGSQDALYELERAINSLGLKGIALESSTESFTLGSPEIFPLYEKVSQLNIPIIIHPCNIKLKNIPSNGLKHAIMAQIAVEIENTNACVEVMFSILPRFPDLKFLMPHHGGGFPLWKGRVLAGYLPDTGWAIPDSLKGLPRTPRIRKQLGLDKHFDSIFEKMYFDTSGFQGWMPITRASLSVIRADRLCFGTDYGFEMLEAKDIKGFIEDIKQLDLSETDKRNILGENIRRLFSIH